jgi:hypothetical protein
MWLTLVANLPILLALGVSIAVGLVLVAHRHDLVSGLALAGFCLLFLTNLVSIFTPSLAGLLAHARSPRNARIVLSAFTLADSTVAALAVGCLIGAFWLGRHARTSES